MKKTIAEQEAESAAEGMLGNFGYGIDRETVREFLRVLAGYARQEGIDAAAFMALAHEVTQEPSP